MKKIALITPLVALLWGVLSCSQEYDLATMNKTITIGGDQFVFPLGNTANLVVDSLLDFSSIKELKRDDDGNYYFDYSKVTICTIPLQDVRESMSVDPDTKKLRTQVGTPPDLTDEVLDYMEKMGMFPVYFPISNPDDIFFTLDLSEGLAEGVVRLDSVRFETSAITVKGNVSCPGVSKFPRFGLTAEHTVPARFNIRDSRVTDGVLKDTTYAISTGDVAFDPVLFSLADMYDSTGRLVYKDTISFKSMVVIIPDKEAYKKVRGKEITVELSVSFAGEDGGPLVPEIVYGLVDRSADPLTEIIKLTGIPDYMVNSVLDLDNPMVRINISSNSTVPVEVPAEFTTYNLQEVSIAHTSASLITDYAENPWTPFTNSYIVANNPPVLEGVTGVVADIDTLVHRIPNLLELDFAPHTYIGSAQSSQTIYLSEDIDVEFDCNFTLPLQFGPQMFMEFRDTITGMPELLGEVLEKNDASLIGTAHSTLPVDLAFKVNMLDENGKSLGIVSSEGTIPKGESESQPSEIQYSLDLKSSSNARKISRLELVFDMKEGNYDCLNENHYVQLSLQVSVPGGIELEIKD